MRCTLFHEEEVQRLIKEDPCSGELSSTLNIREITLDNFEERLAALKETENGEMAHGNYVFTLSGTNELIKEYEASIRQIKQAIIDADCYGANRLVL